jgi:hypothetical protein
MFLVKIYTLFLAPNSKEGKHSCLLLDYCLPHFKEKLIYQYIFQLCMIKIVIPFELREKTESNLKATQM